VVAPLLAVCPSPGPPSWRALHEEGGGGILPRFVLVRGRPGRSRIRAKVCLASCQARRPERGPARPGPVQGRSVFCCFFFSHSNKTPRGCRANGRAKPLGRLLHGHPALLRGQLASCRRSWHPCHGIYRIGANPGATDWRRAPRPGAVGSASFPGPCRGPPVASARAPRPSAALTGPRALSGLAVVWGPRPAWKSSLTSILASAPTWPAPRPLRITSRALAGTPDRPSQLASASSSGSGQGIVASCPA